ncbi:MAG: hypothetical protein K1X64_02035 [Myxococcaceae bacterium]|nr:hypothetical protein [Myxococcaceae bacterium]
MKARRGWGLCCLLFATSTWAGLRASYGGKLRVGAAVSTEKAPWLLDTPAEATLASLRAQSLCRLETDGRWVPVLAESMTRTPHRTLRIVLRSPLNADDVIAAWKRLWASASPYRVLLSPFTSAGADWTKWKIDATTLELPLGTVAADVEAGLCHPALAVTDAEGRGISAWSMAADAFTGNARFPEGQPFLAHVELKNTDARGGERLLEQKKIQLLLGGASKISTQAPLPYATYLLFNRAKAGDAFRQAVDASADRAQLAAIFAQAPAAPLNSLLPRMPAAPDTPVAKPAPLTPAKPLALLYDASRDDQRAAAERLQVKLKPLGYALSLKGLRRAELLTAWSRREYDVMLFSVLVPPTSASALSLVWEVAGVALPPTSEALAELERKGKTELPLIPLFTQGLPVAAAPELLGLGFDGFGRLRLENLFFSAEPL